jgi:hypothetical protein
MAKLSQRQIVATIEPVSDTNPKWTGFTFAQVSGGEITASVEKIYEGGKKFPTVLCAPAEIGDITLTAHYDDDTADTATSIGIAKKITDLRQFVGQAYYNVYVKTLDCDIAVKGLDRTYSNCLLVGITEPDGDSSSGAPATFALTFSVQTVV